MGLLGSTPQAGPNCNWGSADAMTGSVKLAVVTGGHSFDVPAFHELFRRMEGIAAYIQSMDDFASSPKEIGQDYDAILFYIMLQEGPADEGLPWYAGKPLTALSKLGEKKQGLIVLHHALLAYPDWAVWDALTGISDRGFEYHLDQTVRSDIVHRDHPITQGLDSWVMVDETYEMQKPGADSEVLITCDHPKSMKTIAWTREHRNARVFCYQGGHDDHAYSHRTFSEVLRRGIRWSTGRI